MASIGFVTPALGWRSPRGSLFTMAGLGRLIEGIAARSDSFALAISTVPTRQDQHDHELRLSSNQVVTLPSMPSIAQGLSHGASCRRIIRAIEEKSDALIIQLPFSAPTALFDARRPRVYHACSDVRGVVNASRYYRGARRIAARSAAYAMEHLQRLLVAVPGTRLVTNGSALRARFPETPGATIVSSALRNADLTSVRRRRVATDAFTVLFVGFLRPEKGLDLLIAAFRKLLAVAPNARLVIVGGIDAVESRAAIDTRHALADLADAGHAELVGQLPFGPELFQRYADADVLVLPSRSEGTPRVLVEARAFGCPIVATRVGGIPTSVRDGVDGLLVPVDDADAILDAINRVRTDAALRDRLVTAGRAFAAKTTVEAQAETLFQEALATIGTSRGAAA